MFHEHEITMQNTQISQNCTEDANKLTPEAVDEMSADTLVTFIYSSNPEKATTQSILIELSMFSIFLNSIINYMQRDIPLYHPIFERLPYNYTIVSTIWIYHCCSILFLLKPYLISKTF